MLLHQLLVTGRFQGTNRPDHDLAKVQAAPPQRRTTPTLRPLHRERYRIATGLFRRSYNCLRLIALGGLNKFSLTSEHIYLTSNFSSVNKLVPVEVGNCLRRSEAENRSAG